MFLPSPRSWLTVSFPYYPGFPARRALPPQRFCPVSTVFPLRCAPSARRFFLVPTVFPFRRASSARRFQPACAIFPLRCALIARRSRSSVPFSQCVERYSFGDYSCPSRLPFCPLLHSFRSPLLLSFFCRLLPYSTDNLALRQLVRQTVTLGFGLTHLCCVVVYKSECTFEIVQI